MFDGYENNIFEFDISVGEKEGSLFSQDRYPLMDPPWCTDWL